MVVVVVVGAVVVVLVGGGTGKLISCALLEAGVVSVAPNITSSSIKLPPVVPVVFGFSVYSLGFVGLAPGFDNLGANLSNGFLFSTGYG